MVESAGDLPPPVSSLLYRKARGKDASESIYLFDQEAAKAGIVYHAEYGADRWRSFAFSITVNEKDEDAAQRIVTRLNPKYEPRRTARFSGWWSPIEPTRLTKAYKDHPWIFAVYREGAGERGDGLQYIAFLFRNRDRTVFGVKEWLGKDMIVRNDVLEAMAHRVVVDDRFRAGLISDDPDLPDLWKKR